MELALAGDGTVTRGGRAKLRDEPERRCIASGQSGSTERLIRFAVGPDGAVVPDLAGRLPGRGVWLTADRALAERAVRKRLFARAFRADVKVPEDLPDLLERLLAARLVEIVSLARKAGQAVTGFEKVRARLGSGRVGALLTASDAASDGRGKLERMARDVPQVALLDAAELGLAFGRDFAIHAALDAGGIADRALGEAGRLSGFRSPPAFADTERRDAVPSLDARQDGPGAAPGQGDR